MLLLNPPRDATAPTDGSVLPDTVGDGVGDSGVPEAGAVEFSEGDVTVWCAGWECGSELVIFGAWDATPLDCPKFDRGLDDPRTPVELEP